MSSDYIKVADIILELEGALKGAGLWEQARPAAQALASQEPFCVDTLNFSQWLQFVFVARVQFIVEHSIELPEKSDIASMAEQCFASGKSDAKLIIHILRNFDQLIASQ